jgi:hypothetical protein
MNGSLLQLLQRLNEAQVEYILVGGMAAVLHGAPVATGDVDIVHRRTPANVARLLALLALLEAHYRGQPAGRILQPTTAALTGSGHNNLATILGPLDLLCELAPGVGFDELLPDTEFRSAGDLTIRIPTLRKLIEIKADTGRPKDLLLLPILLKLDRPDND